MPTKNQSPNKHLLNDWAIRALRALNSHYAASRHFSSRNYQLGIPSMILTTLIGTGVFASTQLEIDFYIKIIAGLISLLITILTGIQTFFRYSERAEKHKHYGARYSSVKREIEQLLTMNDNDLRKETIDDIRTKIDTLAIEAPELPKKFLIESRKKYPVDHIATTLKFNIDENE